MPFLRPSLDTIYQRIKADAETRLTSNVKIARFSVIGILITVFAGAMHLLYGALIWFSKQFFPDTSIEEYLEKHGALKGITRKEATYATGVITITGTNSTVIPDGTLWQDSNGIQYATDDIATISGSSVQVAVTATTSGINGNTLDSSLNIVSPLSGVDSSSTKYSGFDDGRDIETDEQYRRRILEVFKAPPSGGLETDYVRWAKTITGVDKAWCKPTYQGAGTVGIAISDLSGNPVSPSIKTECQEYIDSVRPLGVVSTVENIIRNEVDFEISITPNTTDIQNNITTNLENLFLDESIPGTTFVLSRINTIIGQSGVTNYEITAIDVNSSPVAVDDIVSTGFNYLVFNNITFSTL